MKLVSEYLVITAIIIIIIDLSFFYSSFKVNLVQHKVFSFGKVYDK
jgi:hypothetical protein